MKDWKERLNQQFLFTQDKDFTWTAVPEGRCITGLTKTEDLIHFIEQIISERDKEWAEHNKKHLNIAINAYDITLPPELIKNLQTLIK